MVAAFTWRGALTAADVVNAGPLALIDPLLDQLDIEAILDAHLPSDPQQEYSHGQVLRVLLAARLCQPTALVNVAAWAAQSGADILANIPVDKLNDDRLGRALDAFFDHRHSILGSCTARALQLSGLELRRLHFDPTDVVLCGSYAASQPRPERQAGWPFTGDGHLPPAHLCSSYAGDRHRLQLGRLALVDDQGAVPVLAHCLDGNRNGHTAIHETFLLARQRLRLPSDVLLISDRGTCSVEHLARLHHHGYAALCPAQWQDYRGIYAAHAERLQWQPASFLSLEQQRRRAAGSSLPQEHYELAVLQHALVDPATAQPIPARLIFVYSTADERECRQRRQQNIAKIQAGLTALAAKLQRGHPQCTLASVTRQVVQLLGKKAAARYFTWQFVPLSAAEQAALHRPRRGHCPPSHRLEFHFDAAAAAADEAYDGLAVLVTTASRTLSADLLFSQYKQQNYVELLHHQSKTPLAVSPVFLKSPRRVEALVCLLEIALQAYQILERLYRQQVAPDELASETRMTAERMLRTFGVYGLLVTRTALGRVVHPTRLSNRQRQILQRLRFPTPAQLLSRKLRPLPDG
ncbi:MAG: IS1634 family transposase [Burkholderiales bacterium]|nr:IS1634 family transposase [Burkholderiales bacterium]